MSDNFSFLNKFGNKQFEFWDELKSIGVDLLNEYVFEVYDGEKLSLKYQLILKKNYFSKEVILASDEKSDVDDIKDFIGYFPHYNKLYILEKDITINSGNYALKHVSRMNGFSGKEKEVEKIVRKWHGNKQALDYIINGVEESLLGFFPYSDPKLVKAYTDLISAGAFRESTPEEVMEMVNLITNHVKKQNQQK